MAAYFFMMTGFSILTAFFAIFTERGWRVVLGSDGASPYRGASPYL
jgi:hypothetical protein